MEQIFGACFKNGQEKRNNKSGSGSPSWCPRARDADVDRAKGVVPDLRCRPSLRTMPRLDASVLGSLAEDNGAEVDRAKEDGARIPCRHPHDPERAVHRRGPRLAAGVRRSTRRGRRRKMAIFVLDATTAASARRYRLLLDKGGGRRSRALLFLGGSRRLGRCLAAAILYDWTPLKRRAQACRATDRGAGFVTSQRTRAMTNGRRSKALVHRKSSSGAARCHRRAACQHPDDAARGATSSN